MLEQVELALERGEGIGEQRRLALEMEDAGHLLRGLAAGAGVGHGEAGGNAVGRKKQISLGSGQAGVKLEREGIIAGGEAGNGGQSGCGGRARKSG